MDPSLFLPTASLEDATSFFVQKVKEVNPKLQSDLIEQAFRFSWEAHHNQIRKSGEPFLAHPVAVALILAEQQLDAVTIAAGLLHDVVEDTPVTVDVTEEQFGKEIALLVDGVTKIKTFQMKSNQERQAETYRKMLLSMSKDLRVIIIKFADRLHNLRTLKYLNPERIKAIAAETLDIYAPLAHRANERNKAIFRYIRNPLHSNTPRSFWLEHLDRNDDDFHISCTASSLSVSFCTTNVRFVYLNRSAKLFPTRSDHDTPQLL